MNLNLILKINLLLRVISKIKILKILKFKIFKVKSQKILIINKIITKMKIIMIYLKMFKKIIQKFLIKKNMNL